MTDAITIAVSSLNAQKQRLAVAASNISNTQTVGPVPDESAPPPAPGAPAVYHPLIAHQTSRALEGRGTGTQVTVEEVPDDQAYQQIYAPDSVFANDEGFIAVPNIRLEEQIVNMQLAKNMYTASVKILAVAQAMDDELLDILT